MKLSRVYLVLAVILTLCMLLLERTEASVAHRRHKHQANEIPDVEAEVEREHKLLIECQNEDYRTYIKCLKREKRQHFDELGNSKRNCLNECFDTNCTTTLCIQDCHRRCRTRLTYTKTVETSYDCNNENCSPSSSGGGGGAVVPNITTNIHIQNILPNVTNCTNTTSNGGSPGTSSNNKPTSPGSSTSNPSGTTIIETANGKNYTIPRIDIHNVINNNLGAQGPDQCPCPSNYGCNCYNNPWQMLPQITIGFGGGGPIGGCIFPSWPCLQKIPAQQPSIDCSMCMYPMFQYRCDPACFQPGKNNTQQSTTTQRPSSSSWSGRRQNM